MRRRLLAVGAMLAMGAGVASAQHINKARGFTWELGLSKGWLTSTCDQCLARPSDTDLGTQLRAGWKLRNNWIVGLEGFLWSNEKFVANETQKISYNAVSAIVMWYPWRHSELFFKGGIGIASNTALLVASGGNGLSDEYKATPVIGTGGIGIDLNLAKSWSFTPFVDYQSGMGAKAKIDGASSDAKVSTSMIAFGVALTVH